MPVTCAWRTFHRLDGTAMEISEIDENAFQHVDTSCYLIHRSAFACTSCWHRMPKTDRDLAPCRDYLGSAGGISETVEKLGFWPGA